MRHHQELIGRPVWYKGLRDAGLLASALKVPFQTFGGKSMYQNLCDKAARLYYSLVENHPFADGNKRICVHLMLLFLKINGAKFSYSQKELADFGFAIASGNMSMDEIKDWILSP